MTNFVTYAQNFEDVLLWRALHAVKDGFYIDIGAADPDEDSVTRAFYDRGWHGINVEPSPTHFAALLAARPRDVNLNCLVGAKQEEADLHHFDDTGLSTTNETFASRHVAQGWEDEVVRLPVSPLADIWQRHAPETVHFLKIDVEGAEAEVLRGADLRHHRPWIILAEATEPGSTLQNWSSWEPLLLDADYRFAWFDGLNRFYVAGEHWDDLHGAFTLPPNVFDLWIQPRGKQQRALIQRGETAVAAVQRAAGDAAQAMRNDMAALQARSSEEVAAAAEQVDDHRRRCLAAEAATADLREQLLSQTQGTADLRRRMIAVEADRLEARAEIDHLRAERTAEAGRSQDEAARWQQTAAQWQSEAAQWQEEAARWRQEAERWQAEALHLRAELGEAWQARVKSEAALRAISDSTSWRATEPVRRLVERARELRRGSGRPPVRPDEAVRGIEEAPAGSVEALPGPSAPAEEQDQAGQNPLAPPDERLAQAQLRAWTARK